MKTWKLVSGILSIVLFGLGALVGFALPGNFADLNIWAAWCLMNAVLAVIAMIIRKQSGKLNNIAYTGGGEIFCQYNL